MKNKKILFSAIAFFLLIGGMGCEKEKVHNNVPYGKCDCSELKKAELNFTKEEAVLYIVSSQEESKLLDAMKNAGYYTWIIYNKEIGSTRMYYQRGVFIQICRICNFPDFAKKWTVSDKGQEVYFEGDTYVSCEDLGGIATVSYFDYILTTLIKK